MSKRFQIGSESILEAYASLNLTSGPIWARFRAQNPFKNEVQNWSKIDLEGYPRPKPPPKATFEASETSPSPFSRPPRSRLLVFRRRTKRVSQLLASYWGRHRVDYTAGSHDHRRGFFWRSSVGMLPLRQSTLESQMPVLFVWDLFGNPVVHGN